MLRKPNLKTLLEPFQIGQVKTRNRIVKPAQGMALATEDGHVSDLNLGFYEALAKGGVGLNIVEVTGIDFPASQTGPRRLCIDDDKFIPGLSELAQLIHKHGCPTFIQLVHGGPSHPSKLSGLQPVAANSCSCWIEDFLFRALGRRRSRRYRPSALRSRYSSADELLFLFER